MTFLQMKENPFFRIQNNTAALSLSLLHLALNSVQLRITEISTQEAPCIDLPFREGGKEEPMNEKLENSDE